MYFDILYFMSVDVFMFIEKGEREKAEGEAVFAPFFLREIAITCEEI